MIINRVASRASAWTFTIPPFKDLLSKYVGDGKGWVDPFAGYNSPAEITNDFDPESPVKYHMDSLEFSRDIVKSAKGVIFDPPYSYRQITEHYKAFGKKATSLDTSYNFYHRVMKELNPKIEQGGITISFGWNSNGFPKTWGYEMIEILIVAHGLHHNDTICVVQRKTV